MFIKGDGNLIGLDGEVWGGIQGVREFIPRRKKSKERTQLYSVSIPGVIGVLAGPETEGDPQMHKVGNVLGYWFDYFLRGVSVCVDGNKR